MKVDLMSVISFIFVAVIVYHLTCSSHDASTYVGSKHGRHYRYCLTPIYIIVIIAILCSVYISSSYSKK